jgi:hypothetical protein
VIATVPLSVGDDPVAAADNLRDYFALYIGGMGTRERNFYNLLAREMGYEEQAVLIQERYLSRDRAGAATAVPFGLIDETALVGPRSAWPSACGLGAGTCRTVTLWPVGQPTDAAVTAMRTAASALDLAVPWPANPPALTSSVRHPPLAASRSGSAIAIHDLLTLARRGSSLPG